MAGVGDCPVLGLRPGRQLVRLDLAGGENVLDGDTLAGFLVWGILMAARNEQPPLASPAGIIAIGAGALVGSIALLVISFCGSCRGRKE